MRAAFAIACLLLVIGATPMPCPTVIPVASPAASASPSPTPLPTPVPTPTIPMLAPDAAPQILWVQLSSTTPRAGDALAVTVLASSNVASVELRVGGYGMGMTKTDVGHFELTTQVPSLPFFMSHNVTLQIIARNTAGVPVEQDVAMQIR
jgi:hypothetical protein